MITLKFKERHYTIYKDIRIPLTIAIIADTHGHYDNRIIDSLQKNEVDIIAIVGDLVDENRPLSMETICFLKQCAQKAPVYMSLGNNDEILSEIDIRKIQDLGIIILDNQWRKYMDEIYIAGMTSAMVLRCRQYGLHSRERVFSETEWLNNYEQMKGFKILLDHHPENYRIYTREKKIDLILSGHTHGGQIAIFGHGLLIPGQKGTNKISGGVYDNKLIVSRGLSNTLPIPRWGNPIEMVYVHIKKSKIVQE